MTNKEVYDHIVATSGSGRLDSDEWWLPCPACGDEKHFSVNVKYGSYNCFKCPLGGSIGRYILQNPIQWRSVISSMQYRTGFRNPSDMVESAIPSASPFVRDVVCPSRMFYLYEKETREGFPIRLAKAYLIARGLTIQDIFQYRPFVKPYEPIVYFPYWNDENVITFYVGRKLTNSEGPKTIEPKDSEKPLFGLHVHKPKSKMVTLVEGIFDHVATENSYAMLGSSVSVKQIAALKMYAVQKILVIGDPDAHEKTRANARRLNSFGFVAFPVLLDGNKDPADLGRNVMSMIIKELLTSTEHLNRVQDIYISSENLRVKKA